MLAEVAVASLLLALLLLPVARMLGTVSRLEWDGYRRLEMAHLARGKLAELAAAARRDGLVPQSFVAPERTWHPVTLNGASGLEWKWLAEEWVVPGGAGSQSLVRVQVEVRCGQCRPGADGGVPALAVRQIVPGS